MATYKLYQMTEKYSKWSLKHAFSFSIQGPPNFTQIGIFGLKINPLATLDWHPDPIVHVKAEENNYSFGRLTAESRACVISDWL
jgi:hypothetical protein